jgi:alanine racemase
MPSKLADQEPRPQTGMNPAIEDRFHGSPCWLDIDLEAVAYNVRTIGARLPRPTTICAVVKADAYGLGAEAIARAALRGGATMLAVARAAEGVALRKCGIATPILLLAAFGPDETDELLRYRITPTLTSVGDVELVACAARGRPPVGVQLKVDTGLTRFGAGPDEALEILRRVANAQQLRLGGLYTHFANADEGEAAFVDEQLARFVEVVGRARSIGVDPPVLHAANTAAALRFRGAALDMVRIGIGLSGHGLSGVRGICPRPAAALRARVVRIQHIAAGTSVGYGRDFVAPRPMTVGVVAAGYADGVPRLPARGTGVSVRGEIAPFVGRVSMDQCVVDLTRIDQACVGDVATVFGGPVDLRRFAESNGTIEHEALCRVGARVERRYAGVGSLAWRMHSERSVAAST